MNGGTPLAYCVIFDLDGVLLDSEKVMEEAYRAAIIGENQKNPPPFSSFSVMQGMPLREIVRRLGMSSRFVRRFEEESLHRIHRIKIYRGVKQILTGLSRRGFVLALNTGKERRRTDILLGRFGIRKYFPVTITGDEVKNGKPHPESIERIATMTAIPRKRIIFVGDMPADVACARAAGVKSVEALWGKQKLDGASQKRGALKADYSVEDVKQLMEVLLRWSR